VATLTAAAVLGELNRGSGNVIRRGDGTEYRPGVRGCLDPDLPWRVVLVAGPGAQTRVGVGVGAMADAGGAVVRAIEVSRCRTGAMEERSETRARDKGNVQIFFGMEGNISFLINTMINYSD
jgi:hypothetical protein